MHIAYTLIADHGESWSYNKTYDVTVTLSDLRVTPNFSQDVR